MLEMDIELCVVSIKMEIYTFVSPNQCTKGRCVKFSCTMRVLQVQMNLQAQARPLTHNTRTGINACHTITKEFHCKMR